MQIKQTLGWGEIAKDGSEIWDAEPVFKGEKVKIKDWLKLLFYPKKWFLYRYIKKHVKQELKWKGSQEVIRILDLGCGTGADVISFKKLFGRKVEVIGADVVQLEIDLAKEKIKKSGVWAEVVCYDGNILPFESRYFDAVYTSDVLGHVKSVSLWLKEINRVLKDDGVVAIFAESKLGPQALIRNYLFKNGLNVDPHEKFHISLFSKVELKEKVEKSGFVIEKMLGLFLFSFFVHPDEFVVKLQNQKRFFFLRQINKFLYWLKNILHPYSTALGELSGLIEAYLVGRWVEAQGYIILAKKKK